ETLASVGETRILRSRQGNEIRFEYDVHSNVSNSNKPSSFSYAKPLRIIVTGPNLRHTDRIRVVLINYEKTTGSCGLPSYERDPHYVIDLSYYGRFGAWVGSMEDARIILNGREVPLQPHDRRLFLESRSYCSDTRTRLEVAVVINGEWQVDPVNGTHNFQVKLSSRY
ncbi:MAG TPA: hypothetical protein VFV50_15425, partial [Bdellovibrionales bacterium]|nr:hypothetical protein [Bdellovibrionales bacterium]